MRYRLAVLMLLMLLAVLPMMDVLAAPAPDPYAILDIGPPPKGKTAVQYLKDHIALQTHLDTLNTVCSYPEVKKLPTISALKDGRPWLAKNLRVTPEKGGRLLRFTFRAGKRNEQVTIVNAFLRASILWNESSLDIPKPAQSPTDTLVWNPKGGNCDSSTASNWYDRTIGRQLDDDDPGPGPSTPIVLSGTFSPTSNSPITWRDPALPKKTIRNHRLKLDAVIKWSR